jgi:hypothetical protein
MHAYRGATQRLDGEYDWPRPCKIAHVVRNTIFTIPVHQEESTDVFS